MQYFSNYTLSKRYHDIYNRYVKCSEYQKYNNKRWTLDGNYHNLKDPAVIWADSTQVWYKNGKLHREGDLPAVIWSDGRQEWWVNGERHREGDLPAIIDDEGTQVWYKNGKLHREGDLPAVILFDGTQEWWVNGVRIK